MINPTNQDIGRFVRVTALRGGDYKGRAGPITQIKYSSQDGRAYLVYHQVIAPNGKIEEVGFFPHNLEWADPPPATGDPFPPSDPPDLFDLGPPT